PLRVISAAVSPTVPARPSVVPPASLRPVTYTVAARFPEGEGDALADAATAPGHDHHLSPQHGHGTLLRQESPRCCLQRLTLPLRRAVLQPKSSPGRGYRFTGLAG